MSNPYQIPLDEDLFDFNFDKDQLRQRYLQERDKRLNLDGHGKGAQVRNLPYLMVEIVEASLWFHYLIWLESHNMHQIAQALHRK